MLSAVSNGLRHLLVMVVNVLFAAVQTVLRLCVRVYRSRRRHKLQFLIFAGLVTFVIVQFAQLSSLFSMRYGPMLVQWLSPQRGAIGSRDATSYVLFERTDDPRPQRITVLDLSLSPAFCQNTQQGWDLLTDDRGRLCSRMQVQGASDGFQGCCPDADVTGFPQYTCEGCDTLYNCCSQYEVCVSCCLGPSRRPLLEAMLAAGTHPSYFSTSTPFELCRFKCRTSSGSTVHENAYRSAMHHCFGVLNPPLRVEDPPAAPFLEPSTMVDMEHPTVIGRTRRVDLRGDHADAQGGGTVVGDAGGGPRPARPPRGTQRQVAVSRDPYLRTVGAPFWPPPVAGLAPGAGGEDGSKPPPDTGRNA